MNNVKTSCTKPKCARTSISSSVESIAGFSITDAVIHCTNMLENNSKKARRTRIGQERSNTDL